VYSAYQNTLQSQSPTVHQLRAIAALPVTPLHLLVRDDSPIRGLADLRGATLGAYRMPLLNLLFEPGGLEAPAAWRYAPSLTEAAGLVSDRVVDAAFVIAYYPNPTVRAALQRGAHLIPFEGAAVEQVRRRHRLIKQITIPGNMYPGYPTPIHTIGVDLVYVCRGDLAEPLVYDFTKQLFDVLPALAKKYSSLRVFEVDQAPATPIPLHEGAARYYREVELSR
jgi:TRAP transporter TAXI family solute receptor